jgi:isoquinoline 1-oxidoreductase subunit beta
MISDHITSRGTGAHRSSSESGLSRRGFLQAGAAAGGGLMLSLNLPFAAGDAEAADVFAPNAFIRIEPSGQVVLTMPYVEMGQGTYTSIPMLIAEELEVDLKQVRLEHAPPNEKLYGNPLIGGTRPLPCSTRKPTGFVQSGPRRCRSKRKRPQQGWRYGEPARTRLCSPR